MSSLSSRKNLQRKSLSKNFLASSAVSAMSVFMFTAIAPSAYAQVTIDACADIVDNPGVDDAGAYIIIDVGGACAVGDGDNLELDGGQDNIIISVASGTTLTNNDTSDEDTVIFFDNAENDLVLEVQDGASLRGENGVVFLEGDNARVVNRGDIIGTGAAEEGVVYIDRDADGRGDQETIIVNDVTGRILAQEGGPAIGIEVLLVDSQDDAEDIGAQNAIPQFTTVRIVNRDGGLIQTTSLDDGQSDDDDAINIAGNPGTTGGFDRACFEINDTTNCHVNLTLINQGIIRSIEDSGGVAGITIEDDAIFHGRITNHATGLITGTRNGIRIGDAATADGMADHTGKIINLGNITGTGAGGRGIDLEGDGVRVINAAPGTISGTAVGIEVGAGAADGIDNSGMNNVLVNRGTISGSNYAVDSNSAEGSLRVVSEGGSFDGDIRGSLANVDALVISNGETVLTHDVLQNINVAIVGTGSLTFEGDRTIEGNLINRGTVSFDLANTQTVTGDVTFRADSTVEISDTTGIAALNDQFTLIAVGGTLFNTSTLDATQAIADSSFLLDFDYVDSTDLVVEAVAAGTGSTSAKVSGYTSDIQFADVAVESFGTTVLGAFVDGGLDNTSTFSNLGGLSTASAVGNALTSLAPDFSGNLVQNVFNTVQSGTAQIDQRLNDLNCNTVDGAETCQAFAEGGAWVQSSRPHSTEGSLSLSASTFFNHGGDQDSLTMTYGYDHAVDDSTIVGFSGSYTETEIDEDSYAVSSTELDVLQFNAYAGHRVGNAHLVTKASYSYGEADTSRQSFDVIKSQVDVNGLNFQGLASYNVDMGQGYYLQPEAGLHYNNVTTSAYAETGGLNLDVSEVNSNVLDGRVGMTFGARKVISEATRADVYVTGALRNDFYGDRGDIGYNFGGQSGSLAVSNVDQFAVQALAGVSVLSGENFSFGAAVNSEFSDDANAVGGSVQTKVRW